MINADQLRQCSFAPLLLCLDTRSTATTATTTTSPCVRNFHTFVIATMTHSVPQKLFSSVHLSCYQVIRITTTIIVQKFRTQTKKTAIKTALETFVILQTKLKLIATRTASLIHAKTELFQEQPETWVHFIGSTKSKGGRLEF